MKTYQKQEYVITDNHAAVVRLPTADGCTKMRRPFLFFLCAFLLTLPFYWLGNKQVLPESFHLYAPVMIFATCIPASLASLFLYQERGWEAVIALWRNVFDVRRIRDKRWYIPILLLMPTTLAVTYFLMPMIGKPIPDPKFSILLAPVLFAVSFIFAIGEEAGWSGYVIGGLQARRSALASSIILGVAWAGWHVVPYIQAQHASNWWVVWQCAATVSTRVLMVWIFNNTGNSIFAMVLFHAMINVSDFMFPNFGSYYDPFLPFLILTAGAVAVVYLRGGATLVSYRFRSTT